MMADKKAVETICETVVFCGWLTFLYKVIRRVI